MNNKAERVQEEIEHQARRAATIDEVRPTPDYVIERYRRNSLWWVFPKEMVFRSLQDASAKEVLDFGGGEGEISTQLARLGARVTGVDISPDLIRIATRRAELDGVRERTEFFACNILESPLPENRFDAIVCYAVLHHVDIQKVLPLLCSCLKPGGLAVIVEPLGLSPWLQKVRRLVPVARDSSPVERPLNREELNSIRQAFTDPQVTYYELLSRLQLLLPNRNKIDRGHPFTKAAMVLLGGLDRLLLTLFPFLSTYSGVVVIVGRRPFPDPQKTPQFSLS